MLFMEFLRKGSDFMQDLTALTGRTAREEIVSRIFSRFCVGK